MFLVINFSEIGTKTKSRYFALGKTATVLTI